MIRNKLDGFTSFKATCVLKLQINAQPFQAGRLLMAAVPMPSLLGNRKNFIFSHVGNAQNVNHVQMDIAKQTEVELRIPFYSAFNSFDLIRGIYDWAEVQILIYSPLNAVDKGCLQCLLWAHFEDVEMGAPTSGKVATQQSNPEVIRKRESSGNASGTLAKLGTVALNKGLNMLRPAARIGNIAGELLGWTKPIVSQPNQVILNRTTEGFQNVDGVDQSLVLALTSGNAVDSYSNLMGTKADETSFDYLKRVPQFVGVFEYSSTTDVCASGEINRLWDCAVSPSTYIPACYYIKPEPNPGEGYIDTTRIVWKQPTTLNYITAPFVYWSGSLVYTFRFVKTDYHSGRVELSYHPFVTEVDPTRMEYVYKTIIDLRENSEVSVTVPFISPQPWKRINTYLDPINPSPPNPGRTADVITGILYVRALTPLLCANSIISNKIECLVEVRAGDDFEVQCPITSKFLPFSFQNDTTEAEKVALTGKLSATPKARSIMPKVVAQPKTSTATIKPPATPSRSPSPSRRSGQTIGSTSFRLGQQQSGKILSRNFRKNMRTQFDVVSSVPEPSSIISNYVFDQNSRPFDDPKYLNTIINNTPSIFRVYLQGGFIGSLPTSTQYVKLIFRLIVDGNNSEHMIVLNKNVADNGYFTSLLNLEFVTSQSVSFGLIGRDASSTSPNFSMNVVFVSSEIGDYNVNLVQTPVPVKTQPGSLINFESEPVLVHVDDTQLPLPTASEGSGPLDVRLVDNTVKLDKSQIPLEITGSVDGGGGGGLSTTVTIDPKSLPLWTTPYALAKQQSGREPQKQHATAGVTETRTTALEGWMPPSITGMTRDISRTSTVNFCAGEVFSSFRQLAKRFSFCLVDGIASTDSFYIYMIELIRPGALYIRSTSDISRNPQYCLYAPATRSEVSGSCLSYTGGMYCFYRGSCRAKAWLDPRADQANLVSGHLEYARQAEDINIVSDNIENFITPIGYEMPNLKQIAEFQIPYYSPTLVSTIWSHGNASQFDTPLVNLVLSIPSGASTDKRAIKVAVAGADDIDFLLFIGPPPVLHIDELTHSSRLIHYPPTGFTPTQNVVLDPGNPEVSATGFFPVKWSEVTVVGNATGKSCSREPPPATTK
ncbi:putative capsid protein [Linepithema humile picorna-like virus 1]|nr:putative capsid protein [Linepithema humile picorna-like virus 1]